MNDILAQILARKAREVAAGAQQLSLRDLSAQMDDLPPCRGFAAAMETKVQSGEPAVIAEIKKASPSKGLIRTDFDPAALAASYAAGGATCLSVLTDEHYFQGHDSYLEAAREACDLPVLRKDFMIDAWQVYQSRLIGADCVLLIVAALGDAALLELSILAMELGLDVLVEVHDEDELERALVTPARLIGVNNRNLRTFETDLATTLNLRAKVPPERLLITESGIASRSDIASMRQAGIHAFLIGETFMRAPDPGGKLQALFSV